MISSSLRLKKSNFFETFNFLFPVKKRKSTVDKFTAILLTLQNVWKCPKGFKINCLTTIKSVQSTVEAA